MWGGLPCIYMRILWKEVFNPIHFKTLFVYPYRDISSIIKATYHVSSIGIRIILLYYIRLNQNKRNITYAIQVKVFR